MDQEQFCTVVVDSRGYLRLKLPNGNYLPGDYKLVVENDVDGKAEDCNVTVSIVCKHDFKNND